MAAERKEELDQGQLAERTCQACSRQEKVVEAQRFCVDCKEFQCVSCSDVHSVFQITRNHKIMNATDVTSATIMEVSDRLDECQHHHEILKFLCEDHDMLCCSTGAIVDHRKCVSVVEIQTITGSADYDRDALKTRLLQMGEQTNNIVKHLKSANTRFVAQAEKAPRRIQAYREEVNKMFDKYENIIQEGIESLQRKNSENVAAKLPHLEMIRGNVKTCLAKLGEVKKTNDPVQHYIAERRMQQQVNHLQNELENMYGNLETVEKMSVDFVETLKILLKPSSTLCNLSVTYDVPAEIKDKVGSNQAVRLELITDVDVKQSKCDKKDPLYSGLTFLSDGRLAVVDNANDKLLIFDEKLNEVGIFNFPYAYPLDIAHVSEDEVAITSSSNYIIDFLRIDKSNEASIIRTIKVKSQYDSVDLKDSEHLIAGTMYSSKPARIVALSGEETDFMTNFPSKKYEIGSSACAYLKEVDKLVVTDTDENTVFIYDIPTNTRVVVQDEQIKGPTGVAVGPNCSSIFVCSNDTHSLVQISPTGRVISSYKLHFYRPYRVTVSPDGDRLAVSSSSDGLKKLAVYKIK